jgi:regulatory protein
MESVEPGAASSSANAKFPQDIAEEFSPAFNATEFLKAEQAALRLIARAEQCSRALASKLERKNHHPDVVCSIIGRLTELNLVNDRRYAELWLKSRISCGYKGPRALLALLQARGIDREDAEAALAASLTPDVEAALLRRCLTKTRLVKARFNKPRQGMARQSLAAQNPAQPNIRLFLKMQGFSADAIQQFEESLSAPQ